MSEHRKFKFRAWDKHTKTMVYNVMPMYPYSDGSIVRHGKGSILDVISMQFTGLQDKNGTAIYEGDILHRNGHNYRVFFNNGCFGVASMKAKDPLFNLRHFHTPPILLLYNDSCEVIGNIYENPKLLEQ